MIVKMVPEEYVLNYLFLHYHNTQIHQLSKITLISIKMDNQVLDLIQSRLLMMTIQVNTQILLS